MLFIRQRLGRAYNAEVKMGTKERQREGCLGKRIYM